MSFSLPPHKKIDTQNPFSCHVTRVPERESLCFLAHRHTQFLCQIQAPIVRLLPILIKLFPELLKDTPKLQLGKVIPILEQDPSSDELLERAYERQPRFKRKTRKIKDTKFVVSLDAAIKCVEDAINDKTLSRLGVLKLAAQLVSTSGGSPIGDKIIECLRSKVLPQTAKRKRTTYRYAKREI